MSRRSTVLVAAVSLAGLAPALAPALATGATGERGPRVEEVLRLADPAITESSGLVVVDGRLVTVNDSGDTGRVFMIAASGPDAGRTVGVTTWSSDPVDVEALAPASNGEVWVADIGDNDAVRDTVQVARVPVGVGERSVEPVRYDLVLPDGAADAETLLADPDSGRLAIVTKGIFGGRVLLAPRRLDPDRPNRLREIASSLGIATDGAVWPDGRHVVIRSYGRAVVSTWPDLETVGSFDLPEQQQGEGIAVDPVAPYDGVYLSSEGAGSPVLRLRLPDAVARAVAPIPEPLDSAAPPGAGTGSGTGPVAPSEDVEPARSLWPWALGGLAGLAGLLVIGVLVGSLRRR